MTHARGMSYTVRQIREKYGYGFKMSKLWGEFEKIEKKEQPDVSDLIVKALHPNCLNEYKDYLSTLFVSKKQTEEITLPIVETRILRTIELHQYENQITDMINLTKNTIESGQPFVLEPLPPFPESPDIKPKCFLLNPFKFVPKQSSDFTDGAGIDTPDLSEEIRKHVLMQITATLLAHAGFETTTQSVLDVVVDVLDEFMKRLCGLLRTSIDTVALGYSDGFPDELERVFTETGIGGMRSIRDYYVNRVINYENVVQNRCQELTNEYSTLRPSIINIPSTKYEFEEYDDEQVPEIHLGATDGDHSELQTSLQSGFQMLHSLEQEAHLQSLEGCDDETNVASGDFAVGSVVSDFDSNHSQSPYNKRRRLE